MTIYVDQPMPGVWTVSNDDGIQGQGRTAAEAAEDFHDKLNAARHMQSAIEHPGPVEFSGESWKEPAPWPVGIERTPANVERMRKVFKP